MSVLKSPNCFVFQFFLIASNVGMDDVAAGGFERGQFAAMYDYAVLLNLFKNRKMHEGLFKEVIKKIQEDFESGDYTALEELLDFIPVKYVLNYLPFDNLEDPAFRVSSVTGQPIDDGWYFERSDFYCDKYPEAVDHAEMLGYTSVDDAYENDACYWTEWWDA